MKRVVVISVAVGAFALLAAGIVARMQARLTPPAPQAETVFSVRTERVEQTPFERTRLYAGTVAADRRATIASRLTAPVIEVHHREGSAVQAGDWLVRLDATELDHEIGRLEAAVRRIQADLGFWRGRLEADEALARDGTISERELADSRRRVANLDASLDETGRALASAKTRRTYAVVRAPFDGIIQSVGRELGELAAVGAPLVEIVAAGALKAVFAVPEREYAALATGQRVYLRSGDRRWETRLARVYPAINQATRTGNFEVDIPAGAVSSVRPGMAVEAAVVVAVDNKAKLIAHHAVMQRDGREGVFVHKDGRAQWRQVRTGGVAGRRVRIVSGLEPGDEVVVSPYPSLQPGAAVRVAPPRLARGSEGSAG